MGIQTNRKSWLYVFCVYLSVDSFIYNKTHLFNTFSTVFFGRVILLFDICNVTSIFSYLVYLWFHLKTIFHKCI